VRARALLTMLMVLFVLPATAAAQSEPTTSPDQQQTQTGGASPSSGGAEYGTDPAAPPRVIVPGVKAVRMDNGYAAAPAGAPVEVQNAIFAANEIVGKPYKYGGGHAKLNDTGYDCSGTISYALRGGGFMKGALHSGAFMRWGAAGAGEWITVYTNPGHAYVVIAGLRLDTSAAGERRSSGKGPRWRTTARPQRGFKRRHPVGF
jgi:hypothetical protein